MILLLLNFEKHFTNNFIIIIEALGDDDIDWEEETKGDYISRLECMQVAITEYLSQLVVLHPTRKVILITFSNEIIVYQPIYDDINEKLKVEKSLIQGNKLSNVQELNAFSQAICNQNDWSNQLAAIQYSHSEILQLINGLQENGATALGPSLLIAEQLCSLYSTQTKSEIILCTDGLSNIGVGNLEKDSKSNFYAEIGEKAKSARSIISIMSIEGSNCAMNSLGKCAEITGGRVNILNPFELVAEIQRIAQNPVVADQADIFVITKSHMEIEENLPLHKINNFSWNFKFGNILKSTDLLLNLIQSESLTSKSKKDALPLQIQINYRAPDSSKRILVFSQNLICTDNLEEAEKSCDISVIGQYVVQKAASLGQMKLFDDATQLLCSTNHLLNRIAADELQQEEYHAFIDLASETQKELSLCVRNPDRINSDEHTKILMNSKTISADGFLGGRRKDVASREEGVFSDSRLRDAYYVKRF